MKNIFNNGIRFVKWLLRILPFILLLIGLIYSILFQGIGNNLSNNTQDLTLILDVPMQYIFSILRNFYSGFNNTYFFKNIINTLCLAFTSNNFVTLVNDNRYLLSFVLFVPCYELFLSFVFLVWDVFQFMFTIASKFLNKGEKLNE